MAIEFEVKGFECLIDDIDADLLSLNWQFKKNKRKGVIGYNKWVNRKCKTILLHRTILSRVLGRELLPTERVDHKDLNPMNNQRSNLRLATNSQNVANTGLRSTNKSGKKGAFLCRGKYHAQITVNYKRFHLGVFDTVEEAHAAYLKAAVKHFGEFARGE